MYKTLSEIKRENAIRSLMSIAQRCDNLGDSFTIMTAIRILKQPNDTSQWKEREMIDRDGRFVIVHECLNCHYCFKDIQLFQYCPCCGAFMVEQQERDDSE